MTNERRVLRATGFVPVEAKLCPPTQPEGLVLRGAIVDRLLESTQAPVVLVSAPAGYGKSVVVGQWESEDPRRFGWLALDRSDNKPATLITYLMLALQRLEPVDAGILAMLADDDQSLTEVVLPRLGRMIRARLEPFVLVLDDADNLSAGPSLAVVSTIADHLPEGSQLVIIARAAPALDWSALRAKRRLAEIDTAQLRLTFAEAGVLVESTGLQLDRHDVHALVERTEGWAAGVYLAAASLAAAAQQRRMVETFVGSDQHVAAYLRDELIAPLRPADRTFLLRTSILDTMCGPLCDAVLASTGSAAVLSRLAASNMLLVPVDREGEWYRVHRLFAEALKAELSRREPELIVPLHSAASRWLEEHGRAEAAIAHATAAAEVGRAARLIWDQVPTRLATGEVGRVEEWLEAFTPRQIAAHAKLALSAAWCALQRGHPADHWASAAGRGLYEARRKTEAESVAGAIALLHATFARNGVLQMGADAELAMRLLQPDDPWLCWAGYLDAVAIMLTNHRSEAAAKLESLERLAEVLDDHQVRALAAAQLAVLAVADNDWRTAQILTARAGELARQHGLAESAPLILVLAMSALVAARAGRADAAEPAARRCLAILARSSDIPAWSGVECRYTLARMRLLLGDSAAARVLLSEANGLLADVADATWLRDAIDGTWRQIEKLPLGLEQGVSTLTSAELRVLQFLPTHLSFEQIGRELFVSRNTVKTQAIAAYRKLGVTSRTDAVERATMLGLTTR